MLLAAVAAVLWLTSSLAAWPVSAGAPGPEPEFEEPVEPTPVSEPITSSIAPVEPRVARRPLSAPRRVPNPAARLLSGDDASEYWTLFVELDSGHRITQRFLVTNTGPGDHNAVAVGHLVEPGRKPYRYENGRRRSRWTLSDDRLFFDIAASHLDLHRPTGELRITKDDIEIRLFFDFPETGLARSIPSERLPKGYHVDVLAVGAAIRGTILAPWMSQPLATEGRVWMAHTWTKREEADQLDRRVDVFGERDGIRFYGLQVTKGAGFAGDWLLAAASNGDVIESAINVDERWREGESVPARGRERDYPLPSGFALANAVTNTTQMGQISLDNEWLRFDPLEVLPQPFRWFARRSSKPREVWAEARIRVTVLPAPDAPSLPLPGETVSDSNTKRETQDESAKRSVTGVASITFLNPVGRR